MSVIRSDHLLTKHTKSCGCLFKLWIIHRKRGKPEELLRSTKEAYYWIGFLMADGHINFNTHTIVLVLANKDKGHLIKYAQYMKFKGTYTKCHNNATRVCISDKTIVKRIIKKFGFTPRKTYTPCKLNWIFTVSDNLFLSFLIGFIDGDGCIRKVYNREDCSISLEVYHTWKDNFNRILKRLAQITKIISPKARITKRGYVAVRFTNSIITNFLKKKAMSLKIPYLKRKWGAIDSTRTSQRILRKKRELRVIHYYKKGTTIKNISTKLNIPYDLVFSILQRTKQWRRTNKKYVLA
jgi:hypothetical protein